MAIENDASDDQIDIVRSGDEFMFYHNFDLNCDVLSNINTSNALRKRNFGIRGGDELSEGTCQTEDGSVRFVLMSICELKAQVSFSDSLMSVSLSICLSVCKLFNFFSRTTGPISTKLCIKNPSVEGIHICSNEGQRLYQRVGNNFLKILR